MIVFAPSFEQRAPETLGARKFWLQNRASRRKRAVALAAGLNELQTSCSPPRRPLEKRNGWGRPKKVKGPAAKQCETKQQPSFTVFTIAAI